MTSPLRAPRHAAAVPTEALAAFSPRPSRLMSSSPSRRWPRPRQPVPPPARSARALRGRGVRGQRPGLPKRRGLLQEGRRGRSPPEQRRVPPRAERRDLAGGMSGGEEPAGGERVGAHPAHALPAEHRPDERHGGLGRRLADGAEPAPGRALRDRDVPSCPVLLRTGRRPRQRSRPAARTRRCRRPGRRPTNGEPWPGDRRGSARSPSAPRAWSLGACPPRPARAARLPRASPSARATVTPGDGATEPIGRRDARAGREGSPGTGGGSGTTRACDREAGRRGSIAPARRSPAPSPGDPGWRRTAEPRCDRGPTSAGGRRAARAADA